MYNTNTTGDSKQRMVQLNTDTQYKQSAMSRAPVHCRYITTTHEFIMPALTVKILSFHFHQRLGPRLHSHRANKNDECSSTDFSRL